MSEQTSFPEVVRTLVRARHPVILIVTHEEERCLNAVAEVARDPNPSKKAAAKRLFLWSQSTGVQELNGERKTVDAEAVDPIAGLQYVMNLAKETTKDSPGAIAVLRDLHRFYGDGNLTYRFLRDAANMLRASKITAILTSPVATLPTELQKDVVVIDMPLPTSDELSARLDLILQPLVKEPKDAPKGWTSEIEAPKGKVRAAVLRAGLGLTEEEFAASVRESIVRTKTVDPALVIKAKEQTIRKSGVLELYHSDESFDDIGGLEILKQWLLTRALAFGEEALKFGLRPPRGVFLAGPPGTGKTLTARSTAHTLGIPMLRLHAAAIFSKYVGESEQNLQNALRVADAVAPCVLFIDEVEKMLSGGGGSQDAGDSGVTKRVMGSLLTWMAEHTSPVLVIATSNNPLGTPPEFMSRFDGTFFVDLPNKPEREAILAIHVRRVKRDPKTLDLHRIADLTTNWSGRELERAVNEALFTAFGAKRDLITDDLVQQTKFIKPIAITRRDEVSEMRIWAKQNATPASASQVKGDDGELTKEDL